MNDPNGVLAGRRVLIVEDEALIAMAVEDEAKKLGAEHTYLAYSKEQAVEAIESFKPDFAILDVSLTDIGDDYEIADRLASVGIPFIFSSGHLAGELPDRHVARPFVEKPMMPDDFAEAVAMALGQVS